MFSAMPMDAYPDEGSGIRTAYRTNGHLLNSRRIQASKRPSTTTVHDLLLADDRALNTTNEEDMQRSTDLFSAGCANFDWTSTRTKRLLCTNCHQTRNTALLESMSTAVNLKPWTTSLIWEARSPYVKIEGEVANRISKASQSFGRLQAPVRNRQSLQLNTKLEVCKAVV
ncbi:hypothetical protein SprV_0200967800 [Sparganum proliferum]